MSSKRARRRAKNPHREYWRPSGVVAISVLTVLLTVTALGCAWMLGAMVVAGIGPLEPVNGRVAPWPAWMAYLTLVVGGAGAAQLAWRSAGYLRRVATGQVPRVDKHREERMRRRAELSGRLPPSDDA